MSNLNTDQVPAFEARPLKELSESGMLWLINRTVFHPRGLSLCLVAQDGEVVGWTLIGDGSEVTWFEEDVDKEKFLTATATLDEALGIEEHDSTIRRFLLSLGDIVEKKGAWEQ